MRLQITYDRFTDEAALTRGEARKLIDGLKADVRAVSLAAERSVKSQMPVDTGRARASWGHWTPGDLVRLNANAAPGDAAWQEDAGGLAIEQGSNVEYVDYLNAGHSRQAPAGFIDLVEERAQRELDARVDARIGRFT